jgi:GntR family transcriptional regulator
LVDHVVIGFHETYLNYSITPYINLDLYDFSKESLYVSLAKEGIVWGEADENLEAVLAGDVYSKHLKVNPSSPVLKLSRVTRLIDGRPYEYSNMIYRSDKYKYSIKLK